MEIQENLREWIQSKISIRTTHLRFGNKYSFAQNKRNGETDTKERNYDRNFYFARSEKPFDRVRSKIFF